MSNPNPTRRAILAATGLAATWQSGAGHVLADMVEEISQLKPGQFTWPHTITIGPDEALYVGEVSTGMRVQKFIK